MANSEFNRRDFLKITGLAFGAIAVPPRLLNISETNFGQWMVPDRERLQVLNKNPDFWKNVRSPDGTPIFVGQFDLNQYPGYDNSRISLPGFMNNACVYTSLTTVRRWAEYVFTGQVSAKTNIKSTYDSLIGKTYFKGRHNNENPIVMSDGNSLMSLFAIPKALEFLDSDTHRYSVVEVTPKPQTIDCNIRGGNTEYLEPIPYSQWQAVFDKTRAEVTSKGGIPIFFVKKYGWGHVSLHPLIPQSVNEDMLILDPRGSDEKGEISMEPFAKYSALMGYVCGVVPNLPSPHQRNIPI
jgi:hypothetical protein